MKAMAATGRFMKALVKSRPEPGLWLEEVPVPEIGINDVLVRVKKASICGTDIHILKWDEWAQRTIPVPMVIGHEFMGEIVAVGSNVVDFFPGQLVSGEGHVVCGRCRNCLRRTPPSLRPHERSGRESAGRVRRIHCAAHDERVGAQARDRSRYRVHFRSVRQCGAYGAGISRAGRRRAGYRARVRSASWRRRWRNTRARGNVVITDLNPYRLELARKVGVSRGGRSAGEEFARCAEGTRR